MVKLRKGPVCRARLDDGSLCATRVERVGDRCPECVERLTTDADVASRRELARAGALSPALFERLCADTDDEVRLVIAERDDCPLVVLQALERDRRPAVAVAAATGLSTALSPRALDQRDSGGLFTQAELDAFGDAGSINGSHGPGNWAPGGASGQEGDPFGPASPVAPAAPSAPDDVPSGFDEILVRLEELGDRLTSLRDVVASAGTRLGSISDRLDRLDGPARTTRGALLPVPCPAELTTGPMIRADVVAAAWLSVIPLLARRRDPGLRLPATVVPAETVAGPLLPPRHSAVAELVAPAGSRAHRVTALARRRRQLHAKRR